MYRISSTKFLIPAALLTAALAMAQAPVAPASVFQIDGNADHSPAYPLCNYGAVAVPCDYWNLLNGNGQGASPGTAAHSLVRTFIDGTASTQSFTGGGSKDSNLLSSWAYSSSPTPNKDTLNDGYAAAYQVNGEFLLMFGANRASPSGDANIGIWFFQDKVAPNGSGGFTGVHKDHDIFAISAFTGGGGTSTISVYEWDHTCTSGVKNPGPGQCSDTNLRVVAVPAANCGSSIYCAQTNASTTSTTWAGNLASPLFFEGGVDLSAALKAVGVTQIPCFSSFLEETRSSQSTTAVLKDFISGGFPVCGLSITKGCDTAVAAQGGTEVKYPVKGVVTNTGVGSLFNVTVFDTPTSPSGATISTLVLNNTPGSPNNGTSTLGPGETGTWSASSVSTSATQSDSAIAQGGLNSGVVPNGDTTQTNTVASSAAMANCSSSFNTTLSINKSCGIPGATPAVPGVVLSVSGGAVGVHVNFSGSVCNLGPSQVTGVSLTDTPGSGPTGTISIGTLKACTSFDISGNCTEGDQLNCSAYSGSYVPTNIDTVVGGGTGPGRYLWNDSVTITAATATIGNLPKLTSGPFAGTFGGASASCPICQGSGECTTP